MKGGRFKRVYPDEGWLLLDGGLNTKFSRTIINDNESPDCANVVFTNGAVETRQGVVKLNATAIGSFVGDGLYTRRDDAGAETMVAFAGGTMWQLGVSTFSTVPSAQSVFTAGARVAATQYENYMFMGNGGVIPYKWNGAEFTRHGVYPPTVTCTVASQATGSLTGAYQYKMTCVNSNLVESDVGPVAATFTAASATIRVTIPTFAASFGVNQRRLYRTEAGGSAFKRVITVENNTDATYDDNIADGSLGVTAPTDNGLPPLYSTCCYHQNRLFTNDPANPNYLKWSNLNDPYTFASTNFYKVGDGASDTVKTVSVYGDSILIGCEKSKILVYMPDTDSANWKYIRVKSQFGTKSPFCFIDYNNKQLFAAVQNDKFAGFAAISGDSIAPSATLLTVSTAGSLLQSDRIETDMFNVQETYLGNVSGIVFKNKAWISVTYGSGATQNNRIYQMDFSASNLAKDQSESWVPFTGLSAAQFTIYDGGLYFISSTANGFVYQCESGTYADAGAAIDSYFWTKEFGGYKQDIPFHKDFRFANVLVDKPGSYYMDIGYRVDSDSSDGTTQQVSLDPGGSTWGVMVWGTDTWGGGSSQEDKTIDLGTTSGKRIQFMFSNQNTANQKFKVHGLTFTYNVKGQR